MGKVGKSIFLVSIILLFPLILSHTSYSKDTASVGNVLISNSNNLTIVSTDAYEFRFNKDSLQWNASRKGWTQSFLKYAKWKLYFNRTNLEAESDKYNSNNGGNHYWTNSTFDGGIFLNFTSANEGKAPTVMEHFWFYPQYFSVQLKVTNTVSSSTIYVEKSRYIDDSVSSIKIGDNANTNFVFWGYKRRYQAQDVADAEPPVFMYSNKTDEGLVIAPFRPNWTHHITAFHMLGSDFKFLYELRADTTNADDITIAEDNWVEFDKVFFQFTSADINQAFRDYASLYSSTYALRPFKGSQAYWLTWYAGNGEYGENVTESNVLSNATWISNNLKPYYGFDGVLIDAMITDEVGDWLNYSKTRFPSGMPEVVNKIHGMGLKAGLWIAPLMVEKDGWINQSHPEAIAKNKTEQPLFSRMYLGQVKHDIYYLDPFDPWVQNRLRWVNQNISSWGFDFLKIDFLSSPLYELFEENRTRYMIMEQVFKAIIADLDDRIVVTSIAGPFHNPALIVNYVDRIWVYGFDLWTYTLDNQIASYLFWKYDALANLAPFIKHFNLTVDSDALGRLSTEPSVPFFLAEFYSTYATVGGGTFEIGEKLSTMDQSTLALYKKHLPFVSEKWCPVEWDSISRARPPRVWLCNATANGSQHYYVALFNPENSNKTITIDLTNQLRLPIGTYLAMNQYDSTFLGEYASLMDINLGANETSILALTQKALTPTFLMRSDHLTASARFISAVFRDGQLTMIFSGNVDTWTSVIIFSFREPLCVLQNNSEVVRVPDKNSLESNTKPSWYYDSILKLLYVRVQQNSSVTILTSCFDYTSPTIWEVKRLFEKPEYCQNVTVVANVTDSHSRLETVILNYLEGSIWHDLTMNRNSDGLYEAEIPPNSYGTLVLYRVYAEDTWGNVATSATESYVVIDQTPPYVGIPTCVPESPVENQETIVSVQVGEPPLASGIKNVTLWFRTDSLWRSVNMTRENDTAIGQIPGKSGGTSVTFFIEVFDNAENRMVTFTHGYVVKTSSVPPSTVLMLLALFGFVVALLIGTYRYRTKRIKMNSVSATSLRNVGYS